MTVRFGPLDPLEPDELDDIEAAHPARTETERRRKKAAQMRVSARETARREDLMVERKLAETQTVLENWRALVRMYEAVMESAIRELGVDHDVSAMLRDAMQSKPPAS